MREVSPNLVRDPRAVCVFWIGLAAFAGLRAAVAAFMPLSGEEAYYWVYSRTLQLCYYDHPPMVAYLIRAGTEVFGHGVLPVRLTALLCHTGTAAIVFGCVRRTTRDDVKAAWAGGAFAVGLFFAAAGTAVLPDGPLFFFWAAALWFVIEGLDPRRRRLFVPAGAALALAGLSKFHAVLLAVAIGAALLLSTRRRTYLRSGWFWLMALLAALCLVPVLLWQAGEGWPTFRYQLGERHHGAALVYVLEMLFAPLGLVGPVLFPLVCAGWVWGARRACGEKRDDLLVLVLTTAVPFGFFLLMSLRVKVSAHWAAPAWISGVMLGAMYGVDLARDVARRRWQRRLLKAGVLCNLALLATACLLVPLVMVLPYLVPRDLVFLKYRNHFRTEELGRFYGWPEIGRRLRAEIEALGGPERAFLHMHKGHGTLAGFQFYAGPDVRGYQFSDPPSNAKHYWTLARKAHLAGQNGVIVAEKERHFKPEELARCYERLERRPDLVIARAGAVQQRFLLMRGYGFKKRPFVDRAPPGGR
jgi:hypothetical protein